MNKVQTYFKDMTPQKLAITVVLAVILFLILSKLWKLIKPTNYTQASYVSGGGMVSSTFNPTIITNEFRSATQGWSFSPDELDKVCEKLVALNDNEIISVSNDWNNRYADITGMTLLQTIQNEWGYVFTGFGGVDYITMAEVKLTNLGL